MGTYDIQLTSNTIEATPTAQAMTSRTARSGACSQ
jgi:hypothetical protein